MTVDQKKRIDEFRAAGLGYREMASRIGLSFGSVRMYCKRAEAKEPVPVATDGVCRNCGGPVNQGKGKRKIFCCDACRYAWHNMHSRGNA